MNALTMGNRTMTWRCRACGEEKPSAGGCPNCGDGGSGRSLSRRLVAPTSYSTETFGNENVQQNIVNVFGDVDLESPVSETRPRVEREEKPSPGMRAFLAACTVVMWISATIMGLVLAFFVVIFIKAFILRGL